SVFDKNSSFDRLFPNQDRLSGKGLGNLIALPLHKTALDQGNSCFIDPQTLLPFPDQWSFLSGIQKMDSEKLNEICHSISPRKSAATVVQKESADHLTIFINGKLYLNRSAISLPLINFLKEELNFANTAFLIKKKI